jgi:hypothetical protein
LRTYRLMIRNSARIAAWFVVIEYLDHHGLDRDAWPTSATNFGGSNTSSRLLNDNVRLAAVPERMKEFIELLVNVS